MHRRAEAILEEIDQGRLLRHLRQARIVAHQDTQVGIGLDHGAGIRRRAHVTFGHHVQA